MSGYCASVAPPTTMETTVFYSKELMVETFKQIIIYTRIRTNLSAELMFVSSSTTARTR